MRKSIIVVFVSTIVLAGFVVGNMQIGREARQDATVVYPESNKTGEIAKGTDQVANANDVVGMPNPDADIKFYDDYPVQGIGADPNGQYVVRSGQIVILIDEGEVVKSSQKVKDLLPKDSYVSNSELTQERATLIIKVPKDKLDSTIKDLRKLGVVEREVLSTSDQEASYTFYEKSISDNEKELERLREKLNNNPMTDIAREELREKIRVLEATIESDKTQLKNLDKEIKLSTLEVGLVVGKPEGERAILATGWEKSGGVLLTTLAGMLIVSTALLPFALVIAILWGVIKAIKRSRKENTIAETSN